MFIYIYPDDPELEAIRGRRCEVVHEDEGYVTVRVTGHSILTLPRCQVSGGGRPCAAKGGTK